MDATRRGFIVSAVRGWVGFSKRWHGGQQQPADPIPVVLCGQDEGDTNYANVLWSTATSAGANSCLFILNALVSDVFIERLYVTSTGAIPQFGLNMETGGAPGTVGGGLAPPAFVLRPTQVGRVMLNNITIITPNLPRLPTSVWLDVGFMIPAGGFIQLWDMNQAATFHVSVLYREAGS